MTGSRPNNPFEDGNVPPSHDAPMLDWALHYAAMGIPVLPCLPETRTYVGKDRKVITLKAKSPDARLVPKDKDKDGKPIPDSGGVKKATTDPIVIRDWWTQYPDNMVGLVTGSKSGFWVLDLDVSKKQPNGRWTPDGVAYFYGQASQHGPLPKYYPDYGVKTASGGRHHYYKHDPNRPVGSSKGAFDGHGVDIKGDGGYVIAARSRTAAGRLYWSTKPLVIADLPDAPEWVYAALAADPEPDESFDPSAKRLANNEQFIQRLLETMVERVQEAADGNKSHAIYGSAHCLGHYAPHLILAADIEAALMGAADAAGWDDRPKTLDSVQRGVAKGMLAPQWPCRRAVDPTAIEALIDRVRDDVGAAFAPEALKLLSSLQKQDRGSFESLRVKLKKAGVRLTQLDKCLAEEGGEDDGGWPTQAELLLELAAEAELFHTADRTAYADIRVDDHRETWRLRSKSFRRWLTRSYYEKYGGAPNSDALQSALGVIEARADFGAQERVVFVRTGSHDGKLYLDLCDEAWHAVEMDADGWRVVSNPHVRFRRAAGMKPLPVPMAGASIEMLRPFLNVRSESDFVLAVGWLLAGLRDCGPYPVIALAGEHGTTKSTFAGVLRALIDPNSAPLRALPREDRDLFIAANSSHVLAFDNVSGLPPWISDTMCRLATGGGFAVRQLYSDDDEVLFDATRPQILNGIEDMVSRADLADRCLFFTLELIPDEARRTQEELWAAFEEAHPHILGALLDAASVGLRRLPETKLERLPRMADFALWVTASETAFWPPGTFMAAYSGNLDEAVENVIAADLVATTTCTLMANRERWEGTCASLLSALTNIAGECASRSKGWPPDEIRLSGRLRRAMTNLRKIGIEVTFLTGKRRSVLITNFPRPPKTGDSTGPTRPTGPSSKNNDLFCTAQGHANEANGAANGAANEANGAANHLKNNGNPVGLVSPDKNPTLTGVEKRDTSSGPLVNGLGKEREGVIF
jgi:hypothetical protein